MSGVYECELVVGNDVVGGQNWTRGRTMEC